MSFAHPFVLLLLGVPAILLIKRWRRHGHDVVMPFDHASGRPSRLLAVAVNVSHSLPLVLLAAAIVILAGPQQFSEPQSKRALTNIEFLVDVSGSMESAFGDGTRYDAAMKSILEFIDYREGDAFGLTVFGDDYLHWVPLTFDPSAIKCAPPFLSPRVLPRWFGQGTRIGKALEACIPIMTGRKEGDRMMILLSDGYSFDLSNGNDEKIAVRLRDNGIVLYAIHADQSEPPLELQTMTALTGGQVFAAGDPDGLDAIFKRIDEMQETRIEKTSSETMDHFRPYCLAGLSVLGVMLVFNLAGLRYTPW